jgi:citronellol/citronellal dehydrogenase
MQQNPHDLSGRVAIVTGGGSGIGAATAHLLARHGADVVIAGRSLEPLQRTAQSVEGSTGRRCLVVPTDVRDEQQVAHMVQRTVDELGRVDILVNSAGGSRLGPLAALTTQWWDASFNLNVRAAYFCTREVGRHFLAQRSGAIINISSSAGVNGVKGGAHYASAKAALQMFTTVSAAEWAPHGIRVNCVAAGMIASERAVEGWRVAKLDIDSAADSIPLRRMGTPDDIANAIHFLASDASSYITGQTLMVHGGPRMGGIPDA